MTSNRLTVTTSDRVELAVESTGSGPPVLLIHEVAGTLRDWDPLVAHLLHDHTCIRYNARGYPPSTVPDDPEAYSQERAVADAVAVLDALDVEAAHIVGLSMGGFCAFHLFRIHPERCRSAVVIGAGYGSAAAQRAGFRDECRTAATAFRSDVPTAAAAYAAGPTRVQLRDKNPAAWDRFATSLAGLSPVGLGHTFAEVLAKRPSLVELADSCRGHRVPLLLVVGDEDDGCLEPSLALKRALPSAALVVMPRTGHTLPAEEPDRLAAEITAFLHTVEQGTWTTRNAASRGRGLVGMVDGRPAAAAARGQAS